jgi:Zn-dependent protease with chaperone function
MSGVRGFYYDGRSSNRQSVTLERIGSELRVAGDGVTVTWPVAKVRVSHPIAGVRRTLRFPNGGMCELADERTVEDLLGKGSDRLLARLLDRWERSITLALLALLLTGGVVTGFIRYGVPAIARHVAYAVKPAAEEKLGRESLELFDRYYLKPSTLPQVRQQDLTALLARMRTTFVDGRSYRLEFRSSQAIGANAFALPGGTIVITDAMVALAKNDDELAAVLAHEAGHVRRRHALRHLLQSTGSGLVIAAVTGDISSITSLAAALPAALVNAGYSREFEDEADDAAVDYLLRAGLSPRLYADILGRLEAEHDKKSGGKENSEILLDLFADHPETAARIKRVLAPR